MGDTFEGHGTHVCGSALGAAAGSTVAAPAPDFNGMAPNAKLTFDDVSVDGSNLLIPADLNTDLFPHAYGVGARCLLHARWSFLSDAQLICKVLGQGPFYQLGRNIRRVRFQFVGHGPGNFDILSASPYSKAPISIVK